MRYDDWKLAEPSDFEDAGDCGGELVPGELYEELAGIVRQYGARHAEWMLKVVVDDLELHEVQDAVPPVRWAPMRGEKCALGHEMRHGTCDASCSLAAMRKREQGRTGS